jgi:hypothetical protein
MACAGAGMLAVWPSCSSRPLSAEERIRARFEEVARAAEMRKVDKVVEILSERFTGGGEDGHLGRDEVRRMLALELFRGKWVSVGVTSAEVIVDGPRARANVDVVMSRAADKEKGLAALLPGEAAAHRFQLELAEEDGQWRVVSGSWHEIPLADALSGPGAPRW